MRRAFALYQLASQLGHDAEAERQRSQLVLGANLLLTAVEQDLVDPALSIVVDLVPNARRRRSAGGWPRSPSACAACRRTCRT